MNSFPRACFRKTGTLFHDKRKMPDMQARHAFFIPIHLNPNKKNTIFDRHL